MIESGFVNLYTRDIQAGLRFYCDLLGFKETFRTPKTGIPSHVEFSLNGFGVGLGTVEAAKTAHGVDSTPGAPSMIIVLWSDDIDREYEKLKSAGAPTVQEPHDIGSNRMAILRDPDGNLVEIVSKIKR